MQRNFSMFLLVLLAMMSLVFGVLVASRLPAAAGGAAPLYVDGAGWEPRSSEEIARAGQFPNFVPIVERVTPAVVSVTSTEIVEGRRRGRGENPHDFLDPFEFFFGPRPGPQWPQQPEAPSRRNVSYGSGFVISPDGYILTNYHVVAEASKITVTLYGDKDDFPAEVVGSDREMDIALLKIDPKGQALTAAPLGDSDALQVGEWVLAIGNPVGLPHSVTSGIVSALGRDLGGSALENFIQTDAAINHGNSGGPLINLRGEVVGVNTLISAYAQNVGFAVPINIAKHSLEDLKKHGRVARGYLGVQVSPVTGDLKEAFRLSTSDGALVQSVEPGLPGDKAGLKRGDLIVEIDGKAIKDSEQMVREISRRPPGGRVEMKVLRGGKALTLRPVLGDRGSVLYREEDGDGGEDGEEAPKADPVRLLKIEVGELTPTVRRELGLDAGAGGVVVRGVDPSSTAYEKGLRPGHVITEVNRDAVSSVQEFQKAVRGAKPGEIVLLYVEGGGFRGYIPVRLSPEKD
jgi:serine protease Do